MTRFQSVISGTCALLCAGWVAVGPRTAEACGGTFCDFGPQPMPVNQDSENVLFVLGDGEVEVHIQISIDDKTMAPTFGWLVPIAAEPVFEVGSQPLFNALLNASVPTFNLTTTFESCGDDSGLGGSVGGVSGDPSVGGSTGGMGETTDGPEFVKETVVGAFTIAVLKDKTVGPIKQWLIDNGYQWVEPANALLQQYLDEGNLIAAFKLRTGADQGDIHPIVLRYPSTETCFPLRLTRIAAVDDMEIRVFLLAKHRAAPTNYRHVLVNPLKLDWLNLGANYKEVITKAVDELMADGLAFVTEFAGETAVTAGFDFGVIQPQWSEAPFAGLDPAQVISVLNDQGLTSCFDPFSCGFNHPLIEGLLTQYVPVPNGYDEGEFYANLTNYADLIDKAAWGDGTGFAKDLAERIILPGLHARELLDTWPYLTRMYTVISPNEMIADPIFHLNPDLPDIPNNLTAQNYVLCDGNSVVTMPDGREVFVPNAGPWPDIMAPWWTEQIEEVALKGKPMHIVNNTAAINTRIQEWNLAHNWPRPAGGSGTGGSSSDTSDTGSSSDGQSGGEGGCGCDSRGDGAGALGLAVALGLLGRRRRRT